MRYKEFTANIMDDMFDSYCTITAPTFDQTAQYIQTIDDMYRVINEAFTKDSGFTIQMYKEVSDMIFFTKGAIYGVYFN